MESAKLSGKCLKFGEEKITMAVDHILSRAPKKAVNMELHRMVQSLLNDKDLWIQETIDSLDLPSRREVDELKGRVAALEGKMGDLLAEFEKLRSDLSK